jgi:hypothetical protein
MSMPVYPLTGSGVVARAAGNPAAASEPQGGFGAVAGEYLQLWAGLGEPCL